MIRIALLVNADHASERDGLLTMVNAGANVFLPDELPAVYLIHLAALIEFDESESGSQVRTDLSITDPTGVRTGMGVVTTTFGPSTYPAEGMRQRIPLAVSVPLLAKEAGLYVLEAKPERGEGATIDLLVVAPHSDA